MLNIMKKERDGKTSAKHSLKVPTRMKYKKVPK